MSRTGATDEEEEAVELQRVLSLEENLDLPLQTFLETTTFSNSDKDDVSDRYFYARNIETVERFCVRTQILRNVDEEFCPEVVEKITQVYPQVKNGYRLWLKNVDQDKIPYRLIKALLEEAEKHQGDDGYRGFPMMKIAACKIPQLTLTGEMRARTRRALRELDCFLPDVIINIIISYIREPTINDD